jgi:hypothetical protein
VTMAATVHINDVKIASLFDQATELRAYMNRKVAETVVVARAEAPAKTHRLQQSIGSVYLGGGEWRVTASAPHAKFVHEGTAPHLIRVRPGKRSLRFFWLRVGRVVYPVSVRHPGTKANPFLTRAMHQVWDRV